MPDLVTPGEAAWADQWVRDYDARLASGGGLELPEPMTEAGRAYLADPPDEPEDVELRGVILAIEAEVRAKLAKRVRQLDLPIGENMDTSRTRSAVLREVAAIIETPDE